jgi:hypothetical protein
MPTDGGVSATNKAGVKYGTGYCDAQVRRCFTLLLPSFASRIYTYKLLVSQGHQVHRRCGQLRWLGRIREQRKHWHRQDWILLQRNGHLGGG